LRLTNPNNITSKNIKTYECDCGKSYNHKSSLSLHKKTCSNKKELENKELSEPTEKELILLLLKDNKALQELVIEQSKNMMELCKNGTNNTTNNTNSNTQIVVNSFDPNDKMESRGKTIPFNQFAQDDYFFYTIRFQNLGTADAIDVRIEDVLNAKIDETSILMVSSSHNYTMKRINNLLVWDFKNIYLSPAILNDAGSKGYVQFMVKLKPGFQAGDIIPNNASIYFDSNPAIVTATFNSKFTVPLGITTFDDNSLVLYPNPASNLVQIDLINTNEQVKSVVIYDMLGKAVKTVTLNTTSSWSIDVSDMSKGMYLVEITSDSNLKVTKKLVVQ
jgi:uncharacterized repeat protein (TIGR01451 family)